MLKFAAKLEQLANRCVGFFTFFLLENNPAVSTTSQKLGRYPRV
jgi:hypothetical protein